MRIKDEIFFPFVCLFCPSSMVWCHNGWASNIVMVVRRHPPLKILYAHPLSHHTIEDGQKNKKQKQKQKKNLIFYSLTN